MARTAPDLASSRMSRPSSTPPSSVSTPVTTSSPRAASATGSIGRAIGASERPAADRIEAQELIGSRRHPDRALRRRRGPRPRRRRRGGARARCARRPDRWRRGASVEGAHPQPVPGARDRIRPRADRDARDHPGLRRNGRRRLRAACRAAAGSSSDPTTTKAATAAATATSAVDAGPGAPDRRRLSGCATCASASRRAPRRRGATARSGRRHGSAGGSRHRRAAEVAGRRIAVVRRLGERSRDHGVERGRHAASLDGRRRLGQMRPQPRLVAFARERHPAGEHVEQHAAERVDVGARVDVAAADLLRRDVVERPDPVAGLRRARLERTWRVSPKSVRYAWSSPAEQHVGRLDVAVHEPGGVRGVERAGDLRDDPRRPLRRERALAPHERAQVVAGDVAHRDDTGRRRPRPRSRSGSRAGGRSTPRAATPAGTASRRRVLVQHRRR